MRPQYGDELTRREIDVVRAMLSGHTTNAAIASHLGIGVRTVDTFLRQIFKKVGVHDRARLMTVMRDEPLSPPAVVVPDANQSVTAIAHMLWTGLDKDSLERLTELLTMRLRSMDRGAINEETHGTKIRRLQRLD